MFKEINEMIATGQSVEIKIYKTAVNMTVSIVPKDSNVKDDAANKIKPLEITGTADDLDEGFLQAICNPLQKSSGLLTNMAEYDKSLKSAEDNSKAGKEKADKINKHLTAAEKFEESKKLPEAIAEYKKVLEIDVNHAKAKNKVIDLEAEVKQGSLF